MLERQIRLDSLAAGGAWFVSVLLLGCSTVLAGQRWAAALADLGILCAIVAMTLTVRCFFITMNRRMKQVFDVGREVGRAEAAPPPTVHSVR